jgi:CarD family transcriptional regulator
MSKSNLFKIGDKVVYPMHGAGVIESIEEREILGKTQKYYVMKMPMGDMKVMIPTNNVEGIGVREIINTAEVDKVIKVLHTDKTVMSPNWNKRYRENMDKIKSGNIYEVADVVRNLYMREKEKGLSTGEKKMLNSAKQILMSELILAKNINPQDADEVLNKIIFNNTNDNTVTE